MSRVKDTDSPATVRQRWALTAATNVDISELSITKGQAGKLLDEVTAGREPTVREVLILLGGIVEGDLPDANAVQIRHMFGRTALLLPHGMDWPSRRGTVIAEQVGDDLVLKVVDPPGKEA